MTRRQPRDLFTVFPAHAGVIPAGGMDLGVVARIPRTRGGDPGAGRDDIGFRLYSPHTRG